MQKMQKSLLIFDLDGTLIDSVPDLAHAVNLTLQDLERPTFELATIRHWVGNGATVLIQRALSGSSTIRADLAPNLVEQALARFLEHYREHTCEQTQAYQGVSEGLSQLKNAGYTLAIVTNKPYEFVPTIVANMGWQSLFSLILGGDSLAVKKPDPAPLLTVCEKLGFAPIQSYMIGDSKNDILAGQNAQMDTLGLSYGYNYGQDIRDFQPTHTFDTFTQLTDFLLDK
ncbi:MULTISPECIES: phosphoglycolate phosphatase [unclassified Moraxella]|uniref:phosphoglycolate phosphatase n=1 Tax=unclassified Moraxella TaxID=2685852 RepID=UPI003AF53D1E